MRTLMVLTGNTELPIDLQERFSQYEILELENYGNKFSLYNLDKHILKSFLAVHHLGIAKSKREFDGKFLYDRIIYLNKDLIRSNGSRYYHYDFEKYNFTFEDMFLYCPMYTDVNYLYKKVAIPSTSIWMCSSLTFNVLSNILPKHIEVSPPELYATEVRDMPGRYLSLSKYEPQFFNILGSFNIKIKPLDI